MKYQGNHLQEISFPIGGIGTGSFGIAGNGRLTDWEIFNRPAKGKNMGYTHFAVRAKTKDGKYHVKVLNGDIPKDLMGAYDRGTNHGYGFGPELDTLAGMPHFKNMEFDGEFPMATLTFWDNDFPGKVILTAFNPFIPLDSENSGLPAGFFNIQCVNTTENDVEYDVFFSVTNPFKQSYNKVLEKDGKTVICLKAGLDTEDLEYGDLSVVSDYKTVNIQPCWYRGGWMDGLDVFSTELHNADLLKNRSYDTNRDRDTATLQAKAFVPARQSESVRFVLCWNVPNNHNYWHKTESKPWKNYYATRFASSAESALYCINHFDSLYQRTLAFKNALFATTVAPVVLDAVSSALSILKTPTVLRLEDGSFYGWEGLHEQAGSCEGTCQHVWNYAYALCFLFPDLERTIRDNEFKYCMEESGETIFRIALPLGSEKLNFHACLDGQMGIIFKTYREWKISGNTDWLKSVWENVKKILAYAWSDQNPNKWDENKDGVLEGRQHHTLDMELFGPSAWLQGMYMCALRAATEMADFLGDTSAAAEYQALFEKGYQWTKENLFNGEYFIQKVDLTDHSYIEKFNCPDYWYEESGELKYQIANGCEIDQLLGQWHANLLGLGEIFDKAQTKTALESLYKYNFKCMRDVVNTWRIFALNDEKGAIICSFPKGKHTIPVPYHTEVMTGFEYALAGLMIAEGFEQQGLDIIKAVRDRYDGKKRNPWNEIECGSNYARAMATFAFLPIYSGFTFDLPRKTIGFNPIHKNNFSCMFSVGSGWGTLLWRENEIRITLTEGFLHLNTLLIDVGAKKVVIDGQSVAFTNQESIRFADTTIKNSIVITL